MASAHEAVSAHHGNNYLPLLERHYRSHRPVLFTLLDAVELESTSAERSVLDAVAFIRANRERRGDFIDERVVVEVDGGRTETKVDVDSFASAAWKTVLRDKKQPCRLVRRHLEVRVFSYLAAELRTATAARLRARTRRSATPWEAGLDVALHRARVLVPGLGHDDVR